MRTIMRLNPLLAAVALAVATSCASPTSPEDERSDPEVGTPVSTTAMYARFSSAVTVTTSGGTVTLRSNSVPDHNSPYWGAGNSRYEAPHVGMQVNPNVIVSQTLTLRVPASPATAASGSDTPMGPIGMSINGVPLFNQYAAGRSPLTSEIISFDRYNGHPQQQGQYHYHLEPLWLTAANGAASLIGVLLDGFPVYGPRETDGAVPAGLDTCNGHTHATTDFSGGIYHYHVTAVTPYISGCFKGTAGTVG